MRIIGLAVSFALSCLVSGGSLIAQDTTPPRPNPRFPGTKPPGDSSGGKTGEQLVKVRTLVDSENLRPGDTFHLAFVFDIQPGWHIYWENAGASGAPTTVQVKGPPGFVIGKTKFPRPTIFSGSEGQTYGYEDQAVVFVEVKAGEELLAGKAHFTANVNWLVCKEICLMGRSQQMVDVQIEPRSLPGAPPRQKPTPSSEPVIEEFKKRLPESLDDLEGAESRFENSTLTIRLPSKGNKSAVFFPASSPGVTYGEAKVEKEDTTLVMTVPVTVNPNNSLGEEMKVAGVVGLGDEKSLDDPCYHFEIPLPGS